jgi:hypothetical protein
MPGGGGRMQGRYECPSLPLIGAVGEQLLELIHHQQQTVLPRRRPIAVPRGACQIHCGPGWPGQGGLPRGQREPGRIRLQLAPHRRRVRACQRPHPHRQLIQRRPGGGEHQAGPRRRLRRGCQPPSPDPWQHPRPQQRRLARTGHPGHHQQARARHVLRHSLQHLGGGRFTAEEQLRVLLLERSEPAVRRISRCSGGRRPRAAGSGQHLCGWGLAAGCCHEQFPGRLRQAQRPGQQHGGVLVRGAVNAPFQVAD